MTTPRERDFSYPSPEEGGVLTLYKYMTSTALTGFLSNGCLKLSFGFDANDPFELLTAGDIPGHEEYVDEGFISFTKNENDPHMWGVYADKYSGACLEFRFPYCKGNTDEEQNEYIWRHFKDENGEGQHIANHGDIIFKCQYSNTRPPKYLNYRPTQEQAKDWIRGCRTSKHTSWKNENEYRMLFLCECAKIIKPCENSFLYLIDGLASALKSITLGPRYNILLSDIEYNLKQNQILTPGQTITCRKAEFPIGDCYDLNFNAQSFMFPPENKLE